jgi:phthiocerol/phenolphthiocerol synthesis type-I polyketide synthase E
MSQPTKPSHLTGLEVAIIGMSLRFPGASSIAEYWRNLRDGVESVSFFSYEELLAAGEEPAFLSRPDFVRAYGALEGVELFDAPFFGFTPKEASITDPQHRLFLECAWEALEHAGYAPGIYRGSIGVFAGAGINTYVNNLLANPELMETSDWFQVGVANDRDFLTTRVSYKLNLKGPSVVVQSACSTSLVAIHFACQSLLSGACDMALAGGVTIAARQKRGYLYQEGGIVSPDGHCRAFDSRAAGTIGGSGVGIVVLKRLEDAVADGDEMHAIIKGSAVNNDGSLKVGYTAPSVAGQVEVIRTAQGIAGVEAETVTYVEAHGTGTELGDPIEVAALTEVFNNGTRRKHSCAIGSVKSNFGHLDAAAGVAGLMKAALALEHKTIPPSLHFQEPNPAIDFDSGPFYVSQRRATWEAGESPRRAGVSSFGIGGTNAHAVLEEALEPTPSGPSRSRQLLMVSARTETALETMTTNLSRHLTEHQEINLADAAFTLQVGRRTFKHRRMLVCTDPEDAARALATGSPRVLNGVNDSVGVPVVFMFPGQGAQYVNMGRELYETERVFRQRLDTCAELLRPDLDADLRDLIYPKEGVTKEAEERLMQTAFTQPALFAVEYALAGLWLSWGLKAEAMIGHSIGEYMAAFLAGVFSLEDALKLVAARGRLMQSLPAGAMLALALPESEVRPMLGSELSIAAINIPFSCVVSGSVEAIEELTRRLADRGEGRQLPVSHAFHSAMTEPIMKTFISVVEGVSLRAPQIPYISNLTGRWITAEEATDPHYWAKHLRQTVRFSDGVGELLSEPSRILLEVGPGRALSGFVKLHPNTHAMTMPISSLRHAREQKSDQECLLEAVGRLWIAGAQIDWTGFYAGQHRRRLHLPTYPFERQRYWIDRPAPVEKNQAHLYVRSGNNGGVKAQLVKEEDSIEELFAQQLCVISRQLNLLRCAEPAHEPLASQR